jgi:hypothetical protein
MRLGLVWQAVACETGAKLDCAYGQNASGSRLDERKSRLCIVWRPFHPRASAYRRPSARPGGLRGMLSQVVIDH